MVCSKKGFELSANFIVMLILASLALTFGLVLIHMVFSKGGNILNESVDNFNKELISVSCNSNQKVCVGPSSGSSYPGGHFTYSLKINNYFNTAKNFNVTVITHNFKIGALKNQKVTVDAYGQKEVPVVVVPLYGAKRGTYNINVNVTYHNGSVWKYYGSAVVYLIVK